MGALFGDKRLGLAAATRTRREHPPALDLNGPVDTAFEARPADWVDVPIIESLRQIAARYPDQIAVQDRDTALSYRELTMAVGRLSAAIDRSPARCGAVGILLPNSIFHPVAALACLAAGRAFVPFDLHHPPARVADLIQGAGLDAVVTATDGMAVDQILPPDLLRIDIAACLDGPVPDLTGDGMLGADSPAAILHTSGSTGRPKAIVISQASLLQRVLQHVNASHIGPSDQICPLSSPCTISGTREQLTALLTGATLHVVDPHGLSLDEIRRSIGDRRVSIIYAVPALLRTLVQANGLAEDFASLRVVRLGGDTVLWRDISLLRKALPPGCRIQIGFSSTESPGTQWFVPSSFPADGAAAPLGYEMPGMRIEVLDEAGAPVRRGEIGELVIRSRFVALGLWQDGACRPGPFRADLEVPGARVNASGDLVWLRQDGLYVYAGRGDRQVKIRGQRVDIIELEGALRAVAGVLDAAVIAVTGPNETSLVAFVETHPDAQPGLVRRQVSLALRALPDVMRPPRLHVVAAMPRLPSAKPDVPALKELDRTSRRIRPLSRRAALPNAAQLERIVAQVWQKALGQRAGVDDRTWSEAGGDSLRLLEFALQVERRIGRDLPRELFDGDMRLHDITAAINDLLRTGPASRSGDVRPLVFFFPGIDDDAVAEGRFRRSLRERVHFETLTYPDWQTMVRSGGGLERLVDIACAKILELPPEVPLRLAGYSFGGVVALALATRLAALNRQVVWLAVFDTDLELFTGSSTRAPWSRRGLGKRFQHIREAGWSRKVIWPLTNLMVDSSVRSLLSRLTNRRGTRTLPFRLPLPRSLPRSIDVPIRWTLRRDMMAAWLYRREPVVAACPIVLFRTDEHPGTASSDLGWSVFGGPVSVHRVDGDHATMFHPPHGAALAERFARVCLEPSREGANRDGVLEVGRV